MARVTVEDCMEHMDNQFEVALVSAKRARQLARGAEARVPWGNDKPTVVALREIANGSVDEDVLREDDLPVMPQIRAELAAIDSGSQTS